MWNVLNFKQTKQYSLHTIALLQYISSQSQMRPTQRYPLSPLWGLITLKGSLQTYMYYTLNSHSCQLYVYLSCIHTASMKNMSPLADHDNLHKGQVQQIRLTFDAY